MSPCITHNASLSKHLKPATCTWEVHELSFMQNCSSNSQCKKGVLRLTVHLALVDLHSAVLLPGLGLAGLISGGWLAQACRRVAGRRTELQFRLLLQAGSGHTTLMRYI